MNDFESTERQLPRAGAAVRRLELQLEQLVVHGFSLAPPRKPRTATGRLMTCISVQVRS